MSSNYEQDIMINHLSGLANREKAAENVINELQKYIEVVGPVDSLVFFLRDYKGDNIYDKIRDYFKINGYTEEFHKIEFEQRNKYYKYKYGKVEKNSVDSLVKNSLRTQGAKTISASRKRKNVSKKSYQRLLVKFLSVILIVSTILGAGMKLTKDLEFKEAIDTAEQAYIVEETDNYIEGLENLDITDLGEIDAFDFARFLERNNFKEYEVIYLAKKICGKEIADSVCENYGYGNYDKFLSDYFPSRVMSSSGETVLQRLGSERQLANYVEESIKKKSLNLKQLIEDYKIGIGRKFL